MKNKIGSNQYKKRNRFIDKTESTLIVGAILLMIIMIFGQTIRLDAIRQAEAASPIISPLADPTPTPVIDETPQNQRIINEIRDVFGEHANDAFKLLKCENGHLNPKAINDNTEWGGVGQDIGIFQINTKWQGVTNRAFLFDPSINIRMAYSIYSRDGYSFKLWTCGRKLGI